jgi:SM-20-related protein
MIEPMPPAHQLKDAHLTAAVDEAVFEQLARDIESQGYSIRHGSLPIGMLGDLALHQQNMASDKFKKAGIGRGEEYRANKFIRTDEICWITGNSDAGRQWLEWASALRVFLNRRLYLGLFSFESHFAHYSPGDYYRRHYDAFRGESSRVLSIATYFNSSCTPDDGGELVIYMDDADKQGIKVTPLLGTIVAFLSEEFPHEVLPSNRDRHSIAGWFRLNTSGQHRADPPT